MPRRRSVLLGAFKLAKIASAIAVVTALAIALVCWLGDWCSWYRYATVLQYAAMLSLIVGGISLLSGSGMARMSVYRPEDVSILYRHRLKQMDSSLYEFLVGGLVGVILYLLSWLIIRFDCAALGGGLGLVWTILRALYKPTALWLPPAVSPVVVSWGGIGLSPLVISKLFVGYA